MAALKVLGIPDAINIISSILQVNEGTENLIKVAVIGP